MNNLIWVLLTELLMTSFIMWSIGYVRGFTSSVTPKSFSISLLLLVMMASMLNALTYYLATPKSFLNTIIAVNFSMLSMSGAILLIFWIPISRSEYKYDRKSRTGFVGLLLWNEVSMAIFLRVIGYSVAGSSNSFFFLNFFGLAVTNFLFLVPMVAEMIYAIYRLMSPGMYRRIVTALLLMQIADPAVIGDSFLVLPLLAAYSALMLFSIYYVLAYAYRNRTGITEKEGKASMWFLGIVGISTAGLIAPVFIRHPFGLGWLVFALSMIAAMGLYFELVLSDSKSTLPTAA